MKRLLPAFAFIAILISSFQAFAQTNVSGNITANTTWTKAGSPYILTGNVGVPAAYKLTIEPGAIVKRNADHQILVLGALVANGTTADSIVFESGAGASVPWDGSNPPTAPGNYFIEFQKANLSNSSFRFIAFHDQGITNNMSFGVDDRNAPDPVKNSGVLKISRSDLSKGRMGAKGYDAKAVITIDSCLATSLTIGETVSSEKFLMTNSRFYSSSISKNGSAISQPDMVNCYLRDCMFTASAGTFKDMRMENSTFSTSDGKVRVADSYFFNSLLFAPGSIDLDKSTLLTTKMLYWGLDPNTGQPKPAPGMLWIGGGIVSNSEVVNLSGKDLNGIALYEYSTPAVVDIHNSKFVNTYNAIVAPQFDTFTISNNDFLNTTHQYIVDLSRRDITANNNYFEPKPGKTVDEMIFDSNDDLRYGTVNYKPASSTRFTTGFVTGPSNVFRSYLPAGIMVKWVKNPDAGITNYKIYWGNAGEFKYQNSSVVAATDTSFVIPAALITDPVAVTALIAGATGTGDQLSGKESWYVQADQKAPAITSILPLSATRGDTVTITGTDLNGASAVKFGGVDARSYNVVTPSTIKAIVANGASGKVSITTPLGTADITGFTYMLPKPVIIAFSPDSVLAGTSISITGKNFENASAVSFGGMPASSFNVVSPTLISAKVGMGDSGEIAVATPGGVAKLAGFTFVPAPVITSFTPVAATKGDTITIHGIGLSNVHWIAFGGVQCNWFTIVSPTEIKAVVPNRAGSDIYITGPAGSFKTPGFVYKIPAPVIVSFRKTMATDGQEVLIVGYDLDNATAVSFGAVPAASFRSDIGSIYAIVGAGATGDITVTTPSGVAKASGFYYAAKPVITSVTPATATHGQNVRIKGVGFSFVTQIMFGNIPAEDFRQVTETEMEARVPEQAGNIIAIDAFAGRATSSEFTYIHLKPTITGITPKSARSGEEVTITGADLWRASSVSFGGVPARSFMVMSGNTIRAVVGSGASGDVSLTAPEGTATVPGFVHLQVPAITSVSALAGKAGSTVNITGTYLDSVKRVTFGEVDAASFKINSPTSITAVLGNGGTGNIRVFNNNGDSKYAGFVFVPVPVITGPVTGRVIAGGDALLFTREAESVEYKWYRNGVAIPGAYYSGYSATLDGEYIVTLSKGGISETSRPFDLKVDLRTYNDIKVAATAVTCKGANNGAIKITIDPTWGLTYSATITGPSGTFTNDVKTNLDVPNLKGGTYEVCVKYVPQNYQKCFTIIVSEPKDLALYSTINKTNNSVDLVLTGAENYKIDVNGVKYTSTTGNITLALGKGNNDITISSDLACQGIIQKRIRISDDITAYPNPFTTSLTLDLGNKVISQAKVQIFNSFGKQVYTQQFNGRSGLVTLDLSALPPTQVYVLQLSADGDEFINKIIKK